MKKKGTVFVGVSGGVDSSVSLLRVIQQGYSAVAVFIKTWQHDFIECTWKKERLDAMRVAAHFDVPFLTFDAEEVYKNQVAQYMIQEYKNGRTPNPDVMCNEFVKFGVFYEFARAHGADKVATGHYAQIMKNGIDAPYELHRGVDTNKDQSYFLWRIKREQLPHILFPVGGSVKPTIRTEALAAELITSTKHDSQGICFLGQVDMQSFLSHYIPSQNGNVLDEAGSIIGEHTGALFYTVGQRHGFHIKSESPNTTPQYVVARDIENNTITVSHTQKTCTGVRVIVDDLNIFSDTLPECCEAQFRYRQTPFRVQLEKDELTRVILTILDSGVDMPSVGQSCVFYDGMRCIGGGVIQEII